MSNNAAWAGNNYNVKKVEGARLALGQKIADGLNASLTWSYQRQLTHGAWDEDPTIGGARNYLGNLVDGPARALPPNTVARFGPEFKQYYAKTLDFHLYGDVGIGDLVYASTYWAQDDRWVNEYSEYMQYLNHTPTRRTGISTQARNRRTTASQTPSTGPASAAASRRTNTTTTITTSIDSPTSCAWPRRKAAGFTGWAASTGKRRTRKSTTFSTCPDLQTLFAQTQHGEATFDPAAVCMDEKTLVGSYSSSFTIADEVTGLVFGGYRNGFDLTQLISHRFPLEEAAAAIQIASNPRRTR